MSIVKTDYFDCMSLANIWIERGVVAGSHHSPESFIINIHKKENIKKILALSEDRTPTIAEKCFSDNRCDRSAKPDFYL